MFLFIVCLSLVACASGREQSPGVSAASASSSTGLAASVRLLSTQLSYRSIAEALRDAAPEDSLELSPGRFEGAFEVQGKRVLIVGAAGGSSQLHVVRDGLRVSAKGELTLENLSLNAEPLSVPTAAIQVRGGELTLRDVVARGLRRPLVHFQSPGAVLRVIRSSVINSRGAVFQLDAGHLYVNGSVIASCHGPVFALGEAAGELHVGHSDLIDNGSLFAPDMSAESRQTSFRFNIFSPKVAGAIAGASGDKGRDENLALDAEDLAVLLPDWREGVFAPKSMPRWDADGLDYGALPSSEGRARLAASIPRWLQLFNDYSAIRASASLGSKGIEDPSLETVQATIYRRIAAFLTGRRAGLLARDVSAAWPFAPASWYLRDRLRTATEYLREGIPGKLIVVGDTEIVPGLAERLEAFYAAAYRNRDPNSERRFVLEIQEPLTAKTDNEALGREFRFDNPEHEKLERGLAMVANKRSHLEQKRDRLEAKLRGYASKRLAAGQEAPSLAETRAEQELRERVEALGALETRRSHLQGRLEQAPREILCRFKGTKTTRREAIVLTVNGSERLPATREDIALSIEAEPACGFPGFEGRWKVPQAQDWVTERVFHDLLAVTWLDERVEALQKGLNSGAHSRGESDDADSFFRLLFQDLALIQTDLLHLPEPAGQPSASWLEVSLGEDGYPRVLVPFSPRSVVSSSDVYRMLPHVKRSLEDYFREQTMEPLFLFAEPFL